MEWLLIAAAAILFVGRQANGEARAGTAAPRYTMPPEPREPIGPTWSIGGGGMILPPAHEEIQRDRSAPITDGSAAIAGGGGFFVGREAVQRVARGVQIAGQITRNPLVMIGSALLGGIAQLLPPARTPSTPMPLFGVGYVAAPSGPLEVPASMRRFLPSGDPDAGFTSHYEPSAADIGYDPRGLTVEQRGDTAAGTVGTVQGTREFTFDVPFPEVGF